MYYANHGPAAVPLDHRWKIIWDFALSYELLKKWQEKKIKLYLNSTKKKKSVCIKFFFFNKNKMQFINFNKKKSQSCAN